MMHLWIIEWAEQRFLQRKVSASKLIKGEEISLENSGLSKRRWNELMEAFEIKIKLYNFLVQIYFLMKKKIFF